MLLIPATESDYPALVQLANVAYRGTGPVASWNIETGILEGQRLTESLLREELAAKPQAHLLTCRDDAEGAILGPVLGSFLDPIVDPILGSVWLEPKDGPGEDGVWYLGLLTVRPDLQNRQLGRTLLAAAEEFARERGGRRIRMTVLQVRDTLIAWYLRRGYRLTGETEPFPYGDDRFGRPLRDDLYFVVLEKEI
jgi:ribosomal protein S18 acetylase RimI-like enzyme